MPSYSVANAKNSLSRLIDEALDGDEVTITRHGKPTVRLTVVDQPKPQKLSMRWLAEQAIKPKAGYPGATALIRQMRDEGL